jgi:hypothetical protein
MGDFLKWVVLVGVIFWLWRWWSSGVNANFNIGPGTGNPYYVPQAGYSFSGPGLLFGFNPTAFRQGQAGSVAEY